MEKRANSPLDEATREELDACISLLALSVVQHREIHGFVPFLDTARYLRPPEGDQAEEDQATTAALLRESEIAVEEVLELVRVIAADASREATPEPASAQTEQRKQLRINVTAPVKIVWPGDDSPTDARLQNISWGGAAISVDRVKVDQGDILQILLPATEGKHIKIDARFLRAWKLSDGSGEGIAVRFSSLTTSDESALEEVLQSLSQSADSAGLRQYARLTQRLDIQFDTDEMHATLDDISAGGLGVTVPDPLQIGQSLQALISTFDGDCTLKLRARVVRQETISIGTKEIYQAGLKFEHPSEELVELTQALLRKIIAQGR